ncbi:MAG: hypothetical protein ACOYEV_15825 [Candidatus Nanopelagicales bacterium]
MQPWVVHLGRSGFGMSGAAAAPAGSPVVTVAAGTASGAAVAGS